MDRIYKKAEGLPFKYNQKEVEEEEESSDESLLLDEYKPIDSSFNFHFD